MAFGSFSGVCGWMPWKDQDLVNQRHEFVLRALEPGANISALCRELPVSRKTAYKWLKRFRERGVLGLEELERGPARTPLACTADVAVEVLALRRAHPTWGARKLRAVLLRDRSASEVPSSRTIGRVLHRAGECKPRRARKRRKAARGQAPEVVVEGPNDLWTVDFKGWWRTRDGSKCEPLTVRDAWSRYVLTIDVLEKPSYELVREVFERLFEAYGLPKALLSDNGPPFVATSGQVGHTRLSAWWASLGIRVVRSRPGCPQDNGGHERMHRDMAAELELNPAAEPSEQQKSCSRWRVEFNHHRPHQALEQSTPASVYRKSRRVYPSSPPELVYPEWMATRRVSCSGALRWRGYHRHLSTGLAGHNVGVEDLGSKRFRVWFGPECIGEGVLPWVAPLGPVTDLESTQPDNTDSGDV